MQYCIYKQPEKHGNDKPYVISFEHVQVSNLVTNLIKG